MNILLVILTALILAYSMSEILRYFKLPRVIGQILAGVILGIPVLKSLLFTEEISTSFFFLANIGIILLFFFIGLELNLKEFRKNFKESSYIAVFNTLIPFAAGFLAARFIFGLDNLASVVMGISVSVSSQAISLDILEELRMIKSKIGNLIIASGTVDDVFELLLISFVLILFHSATGEVADFAVLLMNILIFIILVVFLRISVIPFALKIFEREKSRASLFMGALIIVLAVAYLSELLGIGSLIGALIAGALVRQTLLTGTDRKPWRKNELSHSLHTISFGFLIPLFFVTVGMQMDLSSLSSNIPLIASFAFIDIFGTIIGTIIGVRLNKGSFTEGTIVGWGVLPKGDTELVIATLALKSNLITVPIFTAIITIAMISTFLAPIAFKYMVRKHAAYASRR
ncbi:cation:proton antiporter [Candidatus Woesearchaeota archaeon]|nr:cation:proton antiporter [Candidatus Woesearchaeota archaeon]